MNRLVDVSWHRFFSVSVCLVATLLMTACTGEIEDPPGETTAAATVAANTGTLVDRQVVTVADAYVRADAPAKAHGEQPHLFIEKKANGHLGMGLVAFDLGAVTEAIGPDTFEKATLVLNVENGRGQPVGIDAHALLLPWVETTATWQCANDTDRHPNRTTCTAADTWALDGPDAPFAPQPTASTEVGTEAMLVALDVTADIARALAGEDFEGWLLKTSGLGKVLASSREGEVAPRLVLTVRLLEICDDGADNDGDDAVDCADTDCLTHPGCDQCLVNNGGCGDPAFTDCLDNPGAPATCTDIDECLADNGGCGDPDAFDCLDEVGAPAICVAREICDNIDDDDGDGFFDCADDDCTVAPNCLDLPPDPSEVAPPADLTVAQSTKSRFSFLIDGDNPIQRGTSSEILDIATAAVIVGTVYRNNRTPAAGVTVTFKDHPEYGHTLTRADGGYILVLNGGATVTLEYKAAGLFTVHRPVETYWERTVVAEDVIVLSADPVATSIDLGVGYPQVHRASKVVGARGTRTASLLIPSGTLAYKVMPDGTEVPLDTMTLRATEYTVGEEGELAMPAPLPTNSAYTYAVELSADEAIAAGAITVVFDRPIVSYTDNFLDFPVGVGIPVGVYDYEEGVWKALDNGVVVGVVGITSGMAELDIDGDGLPETTEELESLGADADELAVIAELYWVGSTFWRVTLPHLSPFDLNHAPAVECVDSSTERCEPRGIMTPAGKPVANSCEGLGSIIELSNRVVRERVPVAGTAHSLNYSSRRVPGFFGTTRFKVDFGQYFPTEYLKGLSGSAWLGQEVIGATRWDIDVGTQTSLGIDGEEDVQYGIRHWFWADIRAAGDLPTDAAGRPLVGTHQVSIYLNYEYGFAYSGTSRFGLPGGGVIGVIATASGLRRTISRHFSHPVTISDQRHQKLGGWSLSGHHTYDYGGETLLRGDGTEQRAKMDGLVSKAIYRSGDVANTSPMATLPDGSVLVGSRWSQIFRIRKDRSVEVYAGCYNSAVGCAPGSGDGGPALTATLGPLLTRQESSWRGYTWTGSGKEKS